MSLIITRICCTAVLRVRRWWMDYTLNCIGLLLMILVFGDTYQFSEAHNVSYVKTDFVFCQRMVKEWQYLSLDDEFIEDNQTLRDLLVFLQIPRTGGVTFLDCFLKNLFPSSLQCPTSFDMLENDPSIKDCRLFPTQDDYSVMSKLPKHKTSIMTILRNPVDRVLSAYEFSVEMAARFLNHENQSTATIKSGLLGPAVDKVGTWNTWPWRYLVPWMIEDLSAREVLRKHQGLDEVQSSSSYLTEDIVMSLLQYINNPIAHEILHNGATFQIAGLTNNSHSAEAHKVRHCVQRYESLGELVLEVAKRRLDNMLFVGLTEEHRKSVALFRKVLGAQVISQLVASTKSMQHELPKESASFSDSEFDPDVMLALELVDDYAQCTSTWVQRQAFQRAYSFTNAAHISFARNKVSEPIIKQIRSLNNLDIELYKYAQAIFAKKYKNPSKVSSVTNSVALSDKDRLEGLSMDEDSIKFSEMFLLAAPLFSFILFLVFSNARRVTPKGRNS